MAPHVLNFGTAWRLYVSFTPRTLYSRVRSPWCLLNRRLGGPRNWSERFGEKKTCCPCWKSNLDFSQSSSVWPSHYYGYYGFLMKECMYSYCCLCILIVRPCIRNLVYVFLLLSMYSYCSSMYSYCCLCILIVVCVFLDAATLTEVFPCFFLGCKANAWV